jgi:hypothetical protein
MHDLPVDTVDLIKSSISRVPIEKIKNCAKEGRKEIEKESLKQLI